MHRSGSKANILQAIFDIIKEDNDVIRKNSQFISSWLDEIIGNNRSNLSLSKISKKIVLNVQFQKKKIKSAMLRQCLL